MIPRYAPTYTFQQLFQSIPQSRHDTLIEELRLVLQKLYNIKHVFLFESARVALYAILKAYDRPGSVLMPAYNCIVVPEAVHYAGYTPLFADIDLSTLNMTQATVQKVLDKNCSAILSTHLFGIPFDISAIQSAVGSRKILIIEDAAPALGARIDDRLVGTIGDAAIISFQATKVISSENGGALLTNNDLLAEKIKLIEDTAHQNRGWFRPFVTALARKIATSSLVYPVTQAGFQLLRNPQMYEIIKPAQEIPQGFLSTCSPFTSSLVLQQLNQLDINLTNRRRVAQIYIENLSQLSWLKIPSIPANCAPAWIQYPIIVEDKRGFYEFMQRKGIDISWTFRYSCADSYAGTDCMNSQKAAQSVIGLPTYPSLTNQQALQICEAAQKYRP